MSVHFRLSMDEVVEEFIAVGAAVRKPLPSCRARLLFLVSTNTTLGFTFISATTLVIDGSSALQRLSLRDIVGAEPTHPACEAILR